MPGLTDPSEEISVISEELLSRLVEEQAPGTAKQYGEDSGWKEDDVTELRIDFQSLCCHLYLFCFD